ncbi:uncharacterized protein LAJ45_01589 [Morchella importuna]|uniref:uncharacterized protein n=1 Tax=Morchella importuna TaxID=1174673 RepID=UPI001E8E80DC|nr:uncharacterized protein LAJ45_01589 [Morchella importuna]KAH8153822.1 hypothetical protein LAJ45_01589 [Morchella importuna]
MRLRTLNTARKIPSEGNSGGGCRTTNESVLYYRRVRLGHLSPSSQEVKCTVESGLRTWMLKVHIRLVSESMTSGGQLAWPNSYRERTTSTR